MPTRERIAKKNERMAVVQELDKLLTPISDSTKKLFKVEQLGDKDIYSTNFVYIDGEGEPYVHENFGLGGNEQRKDDRSDAVNRLRSKYPDQWGRRGGAKHIALSEQMQREKEITEKEKAEKIVTERRSKNNALSKLVLKRDKSQTKELRKRIAECKTVLCEKLGVRTIQKYFKDFP